MVTMIFVFLMAVPLISAYEPHKQNTELQFSFTSNNATACNVTKANTPNGIVLINQESTKSGQTFNNTIASGNFTSLGNYCFNIVCTDGIQNIGGSICREVTINGKEPAEGIVIVVFVILFLAVFFFGLLYFFKALGHVLELNMDIIDTTVLVGTYLTLFFFYYFSIEYLGNSMINDILEIAITVGAFTHVLLPLVGFLVSFIMTNLKFKQKSKITY